MKRAWRKQLTFYSDRDPAAKLLQKSEFPPMLKEFMNSLNFKENLPAAFKKCGLSPIDRNKVLEHIPSVEEAEKVARNLDKELLKKLEVRRFGGRKEKAKGQEGPGGAIIHKGSGDHRRGGQRGGQPGDQRGGGG
jgi:hypothetical protein